MTIRDAIAALEAYARPGEDLPEELFLFVSSVTPLVNVDLLIKDKSGRTLLTWRDDEFYGPGWHVPGGIIRYKEKAQERIVRVAEQELQCSVTAERDPIRISESFSEQRQRGHFISLLFRCELLTNPASSLEASDPPQRGQWKWHRGVPPDILPVHRMYDSFI